MTSVRTGAARSTRSTLENRFENVPRDRGVLPQPSDGVRIPVRAEGHRDPKAMSLRADDPAQRRLDPVEHLELVLVGLQPEPIDEAAGFPDQELIVGRDPDVTSRAQELLQEHGVVLLDDT